MASSAVQKMMDDELSSTSSSDHLSTHLSSRKLSRPPQRTSSRRAETGVLAVFVGNQGPCMKPEDNRTRASTNTRAKDKEENEPVALCINKRDSEMQLQKMMDKLSNLLVEQEQYRKRLEALLLSNQQQQPSKNTHKKNADTAEIAEKSVAAETHFTRYTYPLQSSYVGKFSGQESPVVFMSVLDFEFKLWKVPEEQRYLRALSLLDQAVMYRWIIQADEYRRYEHTWEGLKQFLAACYGEGDERIVREKLRRLQWKGSVKQLDEELREALDVCTSISDDDLSCYFVARIPEGMRAFWFTKTSPNDSYTHTVNICLDYERIMHRLMHRGEMQASTTTPRSTLDREHQTEHRQWDDTSSNKSYSSNHNKPIPRHRLGPCRHCNGQGHYSQACVNLSGSRANDDTECFTCKGKGHFSRECANHLPDGGREEAERCRRKAC
ncbi:hypothetical protein Emed_000768 [Eimeria media]